MKNNDEEENRSRALFIFIFIVMVIGITVIAYSSYQNYEHQFRAQVDQQLSAIAELKVNELVDWRKERLGDASVLYQNSAFTGLVQRYLDNPADMEAAEQLQTWLGTIQKYYQYDKVSLFDTNTVERLSVPAAPEAVEEILIGQIAAALESGEIIFIDFHRDTPDGPVHLAILVPIFERPPLDVGRPLGVLYMRIDPNIYLYPFIQEWPTSNQTAETLIVRREGQDVLFLNELKFNKDAALNLSIPLEKTDFLAVKAVLGQEGIVQGVDYRGVPSIGYVRAVPNSPWFMVARMETAEIYAPLNARLWQTIIFFGALILSGGAGLGMVWRQQRIRFYRGQADAANALRESEAFIRAVMDNLPMGVAVNSVDPTVEFTYMNDNFPRYYRTTKEALAASDTFWEAVYEEPVFREKMKKRVLDDCATGDPQRMQWTDIPITRKGQETTFVSAMNTPIPGKQLMISTVWDVTERKQAEESMRASAARLNEAQRLAHIGNWELNLQTNVLTWSDEIYRIFEMEPQAFKATYEAFLEAIHPDDRERVNQAYTESLQSRIPYEIDHRLLMKDGRVKFVHEGCETWFDRDGSPLRSIGTVQDVTERKRAEDTLRRHTEELTALQATVLDISSPHSLSELLSLIVERAANLLDASSGGLYLTDPQQRKVRCMVSYKTKGDFTGTLLDFGVGAAGYVAETGQPLIIDDYSKWDGRASVFEEKQPFQAVLSAPMLWQGKVSGVIDLLRDDTSKKFTQEELSLLLLFANHASVAVENARLFGLLNQELTERKRAETIVEARLRLVEFTAQHSLDELLQKTLDEVCVMTDSLIGFYHFVEPDQKTVSLQAWSTRTVREYCKAEGKGMHYSVDEAGVWVDCIYQKHAVIHNDYASLSHRKGLPEGHAKLVRELVVPILRDGLVVAILGVGNKAQDYIEKDIDTVAYFADLAWEIAERKRVEQQLATYTGRLEEMVDERTRELRDAQEQLVRQEKLATLGQLAGGIGHELRNPLAVISNAIYFLKAVQPNASDKVKEYLQIMENETRTSDKIITDLLDFTRIKSVDREAVSVSELIRQTLERFPTPPTVDVFVETPDDLPQAFVDEHQIIQVLGNLIINACQAMLSQGSTTDVVSTGGKLSLYSNVQNDMINITVKDTGMGISPESMKKLFEPLFTTKTRGIGLGLAVSRKLVDANGGRIEVESEPGKGSSFSVYLPIYKETQ